MIFADALKSEGLFQVYFGGRDLPNFTPLEGYIYIYEYILRIYYIYISIYTLCTSWIYLWLCFWCFFLPSGWLQCNVYAIHLLQEKLEKDGTVGYCKAWKSHAEDGPSDDEVAERLWRREVEVKTCGGCAAVMRIQGPAPGSSYTHPLKL